MNFHSISGMKKLSLLILLLEVVTRINGEGGSCVWNKVCYEDEVGKKYNCAYDGPAFALEDEDAQKIMLDRCPEIYTNSE